MYLAGALDYERQSHYELKIEARDPLGVTDEATLIVDITDIIEEGDGDPLFHANADADATGEGPAAVTDGPVSVGQLTGDVIVLSGTALGLGDEGWELPVYQSNTLARPIVNADVQLQAGNLPERIEATLTFGGLQQSMVSYTVDPALDGKQVRLALQADATTLATGHYGWTTSVKFVYPGGGESTQNFSGRREIINATDSPLGGGWRIKAVDRLHFDSGGATLARGDGTAGYFADDGAGGYQSPAGSFAKLVDNGDGTLSLRRHQGGEDVFNSTTGLLTKRIDRQANETTFSYVDGNGDGSADDLAQVNLPFGRTQVFAWNTGKLMSVTDTRGREFTLSYRGDGKLESIEGPDPEGDPNSGQPARRVQMAYDATSGLLNSVTDAASATSTIEWTAAGRFARYVRPDLSDWTLNAAQPQGLSDLVETAAVAATYTDAENNTWVRRTDRYGYIIEDTTPVAHTTTIQRDGFGLRTGIDDGGPMPAIDPDWQGRVIRITNRDGTEESWTFDTLRRNDQPTSYTDAKGRTWFYSYDVVGNLSAIEDPLGQITTFTWMSVGRLDSMMLSDPDGAGPRVAPTWSFNHDVYGRLTQITNPDQTTRTFTWDSAHNLTSQTDELGRATSYTHDAYGRVLSMTLPDPDGPTGPLESPAWQWTYGTTLRPIQQIDPDGNVTDFTYNDQGWLLSIVQPAAEPGGTRPTWQFTHDGNAHVLTEEDAHGNVTTHEYDQAGRRIRTTLSDPDGAVGPQTSPVWQWSYDDWSRVTQMIDPLGRVRDYDWYAWDMAPAGEEANAGKLHAITLPEPEPGGARPVTTFTWDRTENLISQSDTLGRVTSWVRDDLDRVVETLLPDPDGAGVGQPRPSYETVYDALGNVLIERDALGNETSFTYDVMSRITSRIDSDPDAAGPLTSPVTTFQYTATGMLQHVDDALGRRVTTTYDGLDRPIKRTMAYPSTGDPGTVPVWSWQYDVLSRVVVESDTNGNLVQHAYDKLSRRTSTTLSDPDGAGAPLTAPVYLRTFDLVGNVLTETSPLGAVTQHQYDNLYRRTQTVLPDPDGAGSAVSPSYSWSFDGVNNVLTETGPDGAQTQHTYDGLNRRTRSTLSDPDGAGPLLSPVYSWGFDLASQLVSATDPMGRQVDYIHDGLGRVIETRGVDPDGAGSAARPIWQTEFDLVGNVLVERDPLGHERAHSYDQLYRRILTTLEDPDDAGPLVSPTIASTWDPVSNLLSLRDPANNTTSWQYDDQNRPTHETNELGLTRITTYDNVGNVSSRTDRNGRLVE